MLRMRSSSASPPRRPRLCPACGCSFRPSSSSSARVGVDDERAALREALAHQREAIEDLRRDLEEERSASSGAASEAMSMILRLQREKAEVQMESRQFRQFADEKIAHDLHQISSLEDECLRCDRTIEALLRHLHAYRNRLLALGIDPDSSSPQPRCFLPPENNHPNSAGDTRTLTEIEQRISEMERGSAGVDLEELPDKTMVGSSPRLSRELPAESVGSFLMPEITPGDDHGTAGDDLGDRIYTIDAVHASNEGVFEECSITPGGLVARGSEEDDTWKLYVRLQALEADRESLKQEIVSMRTEKAQMVLLKEIAENLSKGIGDATQPPATARGARRRAPFLWVLSFLPALKFAFLFAFWTKKTKRCRYMFHYVSDRVGLRVLLDKSQRLHGFVTRHLSWDPKIHCGRSEVLLQSIV